MTMTGGCLCGQVRYEIEGDPAMSLTCHCKNCQKQAGSSLSVIIGVPASNFSMTGELKTYEDTGDSGQPVLRMFCPQCGSPVVSKVSQQPDMVFVKAGTLDDTSTIKPAFHLYTKSKQDWVELGDIPAFETVPDGL